MDYNFITSFIFGGLLLVFIYYSSNYLNNTALSAILSMLPLSILCCYVIYKRNLVMGHLLNLIPVTIITIGTFFVAIYLLKYTQLGVVPIIMLTVILWFILQYIRVKMYPIN